MSEGVGETLVSLRRPRCLWQRACVGAAQPRINSISALALPRRLETLVASAQVLRPGHALLDLAGGFRFLPLGAAFLLTLAHGGDARTRLAGVFLGRDGAAAGAGAGAGVAVCA